MNRFAVRIYHPNLSTDRPCAVCADTTRARCHLSHLYEDPDEEYHQVTDHGDFEAGKVQEIGKMASAPASNR